MDFKKVLDEIKPSQEEERKVNSVTSELKRNLEKAKDVTVIVGGSDAKGTVIKSKPRRDIDIFVAFNYKKYSERSSELSGILAKHLKKLRLPFVKVHGSRDYFIYKDKKNKMLFEIVPILHIKKAEAAKNITDVSPLHVTYVKAKLRNKQKLADDIRLAKAFCFAHNIYGAESHIRAFSGYALEILVLHYKGFLPFLRAASKWKNQLHKNKMLIDPAKFYKNKNSILFNMNESKIRGPLVLVDPLQRDRNVTAAMNQNNFNLFIQLCKKFVNKPSLNYFDKKELTAEQLRKGLRKSEELIVTHLDLSNGKEDIVGSKVRKLYEFILSKSKEEGFKFRKSEWTFHPQKGCAHFYFILDKSPLNPFTEREGPPVKMEKAVKGFKQKWKTVKVRKGRLYAKVKRKFTRFDSFLRNIFEEKVAGDKSLNVIKKAVCI